MTPRSLASHSDGPAHAGPGSFSKAVLVSVGLFVLVLALPLAQASPPGPDAGRFIVGLGEASQAPPWAELHRLGYALVGANARLGFLTVEGPGGAAKLAALASLTGATYIEEDRLLRASFSPNDPLFPQQWAPSAIHAPAAWDRTVGASSVIIAIVDTGIDYDHPDLAQAVWTDASATHGYDFINGDTDPKDDHGHGTHVAGIAAARTNNGLGIAGIAQASIMAIKVLDADGYGPESVVATGVQWAVDQGARIISMSLGDPQRSKTLERAVNYAWARGALLVAAAGNGYGAQVEYPAGYSAVLAISALDSDDGFALYSNVGAKIDLAAPGTLVLSTMPTYAVTLTDDGLSNNYATLTGTSMATPHVSAAAALLWSVRPDLTNLEVRDLLLSTAVDLGAAGPDRYFGYGKVDAAAAVDAASPLPALALSLQASTSALASRGTTTLMASVQSPEGPVSGARLTLASSAGGSFGPVQDRGDGSYAATYTAPEVFAPGTTTIDVVANRSGYKDAAAQLVLSLLPLPPLTLAVSSSASMLTSNRTATVTALVTNGTQPVEGALVQSEVPQGAGRLGPFAAVVPGRYEATFTAPIVEATTTLTLIISATHPDFQQVQRSLQISVGPSPLTAELIDSPQAGRTDVGTGETIELSFPYPMDRRSVEGAFRLLDSSGEPVRGSFAWDSGNLHVRFDPSRSLHPASSYTIELAAGASDQWGDPLQESYEATFTTAETPERAAVAIWVVVGLAATVIVGSAWGALRLIRGKSPPQS